MDSPRQTISIREALLLIAIIVVVIALLLPAIHRVREVANQMACANNLRKLGVASHQYFSDNMKLPAGYYGPIRSRKDGPTNIDERGPHVSGIVLLLPYLEHEGLYRALVAPPATWPDAKVGSGKIWPVVLGRDIEQRSWWTVTANIQPNTGRSRLGFLECPSAETSNGKVPEEIVRLHVSEGVFSRSISTIPPGLGRTNYLGVAGAAGDYPSRNAENERWSRYEGLFLNRVSRTGGSWGLSAHGSSTTLFFGEALGGTGLGASEAVYSWMGCGALGTAYGLGKADLPGSDEPPALGSIPASHGAAWFRFSSRHRTGVQFCFVDGSVRVVRFGKTTVPDQIDPVKSGSDWAVLQQMAGNGNHYVIDPDAILE